MKQRVLKFPDGFFWGAATSAYQVEGGISNCDWAQAAQAGKVPQAGKACDQYHLYEKDFSLAHQLGQNAHRFSLEWSRIEPKPGQFDRKEIEHYQKVVSALRSRHLEPFLTLWHFTLPDWVAAQGGWQNPKTIEYFCQYVKIVTSALKNRVNFWLSMNEPGVYLLNGYLHPKWPPFKKSFWSAWRAEKNILKAHQAAFKIIKEIQPQAQVSLVVNMPYFAPANKFSPLDWLIIGVSRWVNQRLLRKNKRYLDFLAINYYRRHRMHFCWPWTVVGSKATMPARAGTRPAPTRTSNQGWYCEIPQGELTDMGWEIYAQGLYLILKKLKKYRMPIYITENGLADAADIKRRQFIHDHLVCLHRALGKQIDIRGYFHWSLIDNYEWADGFKPRFGLVEVDYRTQARHIRPSAWYYAKICQENALVFE